MLPVTVDFFIDFLKGVRCVGGGGLRKNLKLGSTEIWLSRDRGVIVQSPAERHGASQPYSTNGDAAVNFK